jgi:hypothetical protein
MTNETWTEATNGAAANSGNDWNVVSDEVQIVLESVGEGFIGTYVRMDTVGANQMTQLHFENVTDLNGNAIADRAFINGSRDLVNKIRTVPFRRQVRAEWTSELPTGQITPMRVFSVQWR